MINELRRKFGIRKTQPRTQPICTAIDHTNATIAGKILDNLFCMIDVCVEADGNTTSKWLKDLFLTDTSKDGIKDYFPKRPDVVNEFLANTLICYPTDMLENEVNRRKLRSRLRL